MYRYAANNPVKYTDPDGRISIPTVIILAGIGFAMLPKHGDGFLYFDNTQPQRIGGYYNLYESFTQNNIVCNIDSLRTDFTNREGKRSSIWLWKGNYNMIFNGGCHIGAEIGVYNHNGWVDDNMLESASFELNNSGENIIKRTVRGQYWTNAFIPGKQNPDRLKMSACLRFKHAEDAKSYYDAIKTLFKDIEPPNTYFPSVGRNNKDIKISAVLSGNAVMVTLE